MAGRLLLFALFPLLLSAQQPPPAAAPKKSEARVKQAEKSKAGSVSVPLLLANIFGLGSTPPLQMRSLARAGEGDLCIAGATEKSEIRELGHAGRWPIFNHDGSAVYALAGKSLVAVNVQSRKAVTIAPAVSLQKLIGIDVKRPGFALGMTGMSKAALISLATGAIDRELTVSDAAWIGYLNGFVRHYGGATLYADTVRRQGPLGFADTLNVFFASGKQQKALQVTDCSSDCGQASLSPDQRTIVFVKDIQPD